MTAFNTNTSTSTTQITYFLRQLASLYSSRAAEVRSRRALAVSLNGLKESDLRDIGLIENDISATNQMPLEDDAASSLRRTRLERSGNW